MTVASRTLGAMFRMPSALTARVRVRRGLSVRMRDGVILRADHYAPDLPDAPTLLVRTPYGRSGHMRVIARTVAERGFQVVLQSCRGTFDSGGEFVPLRHERDDGLDTIDWLRRQPWYSGAFAMYGPSYVGFVQWAVAGDAGPDLKALTTAVTASGFRDATYAGGGFSLDTVLTWSAILAAQRRSFVANAVDMLRGQPNLRRALAHPVLAEADALAVGAPVPHYQEWLREADADTPYWRDRCHDHRLADVDVPVLMIGGWSDIFLPWQLDDYAALRACGRRPQLVIGDWHHGSVGLLAASLRESVTFLRGHLHGEQDLLATSPVRVRVGGPRPPDRTGNWKDLPDWPPPSVVQEMYLYPDGGLGRLPPGGGDEAGRSFVYDPADATPAVGGPRLAAHQAGRRDNRTLEARRDVLVYTGTPLDAPMEIIGPVRAVIRVRTSRPYFDLFVRLCDVEPGGRSVNVCDGLVRVCGRDEGSVDVPLWPTAYRFGAGHRIRVQVSGGAHPRWSRNPGTGAALDEAGPMVASTREVLAGSMIELPVV
jgi:uncharacterized protein